MPILPNSITPATSGFGALDNGVLNGVVGGGGGNGGPSFNDAALVGVDFQNSTYNGTASNYVVDDPNTYIVAAQNYAGDLEEMLALAGGEPPAGMPILAAVEDSEVENVGYAAEFDTTGRAFKSLNAVTSLVFRNPIYSYVAAWKFSVHSEQGAGQVIFGVVDSDLSNTFFVVGLNHENRFEIRRSRAGAQDTVLSTGALTLNTIYEVTMTVSGGDVTLVANGTTMIDGVSWKANSGDLDSEYSKFYIGADLRSEPTILSPFDGYLWYLSIEEYAVV